MNYDNKLAISKERDYKVVKSNEIIQKARYDLNINELKTLSYIFSKVKPTDTELQEYSFTVKEYCQVCGLHYDSGSNYIAVKKSLKELRDKSFWLLDENGREVLVGWLSKVRINRGSGKITVKLDEDLQKYVVGLFENYTQYELLSTLPMKSNYSFRIYELLKSYAFTKKHVFDVDELKKQLSCEHYVNFKDFRRKVIEIAVREINKYTDIEVSWNPINKGRKIVQVQFCINQKDAWARWISQNAAINEIEGQLSLEDYYR